MKNVRILAAILLFVLGASAAQAQRVDPADEEYSAQRYPERVDPCTDGRFSDGRARSCGELLEWLDERDAHSRRWDRHPPHRSDYDPCRDGRVSDGRPRTCGELKRYLRTKRWR